MALTTKGTYSLCFVADYFTLQTNQHATSEDDAIHKAVSFLRDHYGIEVEEVANDIDVCFID